MAQPAKVPEVTGYATEDTYFATRYKQGGRTVYSLDLSPVQLFNLIDRPDPSKDSLANRRINLPHAKSFSKYFREHDDWVIPGMLLVAPRSLKFEPFHEQGGSELGTLSIGARDLRDIDILDAQHRTLGFYISEADIKLELDKAADQKAKARKTDPDGAGVREAERRIKKLEAQFRKLEKERVSVQVIVEEDPDKRKQMFSDIATNAKAITGSVKDRFDQRKAVNRALDPIIDGHPLLGDQRVDKYADRLGRGSQYFLGAKHVSEIVKNLQVGLGGRISRRMNDELRVPDIVARGKTFFTMLQEDFPTLTSMQRGQITPEQNRQESFLGSPLTLRILASVYHDLRDNSAWSDEDISAFFKKLAPHMEAPAYEGSIWLEHIPEVFTSEGRFTGRRQDNQALHEALLAWAKDKPKWLDKKPKPRPEPDGPKDEAEMTEEELDAELRPEVTKARKLRATK